MSRQQYTRLGQYRDEEIDEQDEDSNMLDNIVDLKQINAHLQDWFTKIKLKPSAKKDFDIFSAPIHSSVFTPQIPRDRDPSDLNESRPASKSISTSQFEAVVDSVRDAIHSGIQPRLVTKGSSGSYFVLNKQHKTVGIFKPKNEEPYGQLNPKWTKWLHRNLFPCFFGRSCLIPNLSYISEAAACLLDRRLETNIVPPTDVVWLSSTSFNYDYFDRRAYSNKAKPLPSKQGSFQVFLEGYKDATEFLRENPWPDTTIPTASIGKKQSTWTACVRSSTEADTAQEVQQDLTSSSPLRTQFWTEDLMQSMREELEKLVILDYIMRNTDRGLDNWMLKVSPSSTGGEGKVEIVASVQSLQPDVIDRPPSSMSMSRSSNGGRSGEIGEMSLGAIDNSLAFPWKHPDEWRSFPFGWLFLPASLIGQPFSTKTKQHFIPLLSDPAWWQETTSSLKVLFSQDADFQEKMFAKQMAVLKGQAWNVLETLKTGDQGPLELARRSRLHVWTDVMEVPVTAPAKQINIRGARSNKRAVRFSETDEIDLGLAFGKATNTPSSLPNQLPQKNWETRITENSDARPQASSRGSLSFEDGVHGSMPNKASKSRSRGMSLGMKSSRYGADEESDLGDLGYALMNDEETSTRQVVVERLESVHGAEAFFSWC